MAENQARYYVSAEQQGVPGGLSGHHPDSTQYRHQTGDLHQQKRVEDCPYAQLSIEFD